jgi:hypothetical protein
MQQVILKIQLINKFALAKQVMLKFVEFITILKQFHTQVQDILFSSTLHIFPYP